MDFGFLGIGTWELLVIGLIALIILGPKQMIIMARKAGELLRQFQAIWQDASKTLDRELKAIEEDSGDITGLAKDIDSLAKGVKTAINLNLPGNGNAPIIAPPAPRPSQPPNNPTAGAQPPIQSAWSSSAASPQPDSESAAPASQPGGLSAPDLDSANSQTSGAPPSNNPAARLPDHQTKYPAWTNKPQN